MSFTFFHFLRTSSAHLKLLFSGAQYITKCLPKTMIKKIISVRIRILEFFLPLFEKLSVIYGDFFWPIFWWNLMAFCLSFPKWCNTYTLAEKIKALEHQTFSTHFTSKFMLFWITQKLTFFTHPNIKIGKNGNAPIHRRGFHVFFKNSWPSFTHLRPDIMALVIFNCI